MASDNAKVCLNQADIPQYQLNYAQSSCILVPGFLSTHTLQLIMDKLTKVKFETKYEADSEEKFGKILFVHQNDPIIFTLTMLLNNPTLFTNLEQITGCAPIKDFNGRIHRSEQKGEHGIDWHGDNADHRLLAITLGLGNNRYTGGQFQLRQKGSAGLLYEFGQLEAGDALIFKIAPNLEHRLTQLQTGCRTVGVGWFRGRD